MLSDTNRGLCARLIEVKAVGFGHCLHFNTFCNTLQEAQSEIPGLRVNELHSQVCVLCSWLIELCCNLSCFPPLICRLLSSLKRVILA